MWLRVDTVWTEREESVWLNMVLLLCRILLSLIARKTCLCHFRASRERIQISVGVDFANECRKLLCDYLQIHLNFPAGQTYTCSSY